jgi:putative MATE family efflux protein
MLVTNDRSVARSVLMLAIPALAQQYTFFFIQQYDQFLARHFSPQHQAALTTANYLYWFVSSYSVVVSAGAVALVGRLTGARDTAMANRAAGQVLLLAAFFGFSASAAASFGLPTLLNALQLPPGTPEIAGRYLAPLILILTLQMVETGGIACLVGAGDTRTGLFVLLGVAAVNVPVAWLLSGGGGPALDFGFPGIAMGTAAAHMLGGCTVVGLLLRGRSGLKVRPGFLIPEFALIRRLLRVSVPAALDSLSVAVCQLVFLSIVNRLGNEAAAAHGIALRWEGLAYLGANAFGSAAMAMVSQNLGAQQPERAARGAWVTFGFAFSLTVTMGVVFFALARPMCELYSPDSARVTDQAVTALQLIAFGMPALAATTIFTACCRAAGDTRVPVFITWVGFLGVRLPLAMHFTQELGLGLRGAWIAMVIDLYARGLLLLIRFLRGKWKRVVV